MVLGYKPRFSTPDLKGRLPVHAGAVSKRLDTMEMWPGIFAFCGGVVGWSGMRWDNNSTNNNMLMLMIVMMMRMMMVVPLLEGLKPPAFRRFAACSVSRDSIGITCTKESTRRFVSDVAPQCVGPDRVPWVVV